MESLAVQVVPLTLIGLRLSGLFVFAPLLTSVSIPPQVKVLLCAALAAALFPMVKVPVMPDNLDVFTFAAIAVGEVVIGTVLGLLALIPVAAVQVAGVLMGQQIGLGLASVFNPALETESDLIGEVLLQVAMVVFLALGGLDVLFICVARSFEAMPLGTMSMSWSPLHLVTPMLASGFELALRVSAPVLGIIMVETIASSMLMKTVPQINIQSVGVGIKILLGLSALILSLKAIDAAVGEHLMVAGRTLLAKSADLLPSVPGAPLVGGQLMAEDMGDKTEQPTERKLSKAREDGNIAKSPELVAALDLTALVLMVWFLGAVSVEVFSGLMRDGLSSRDVRGMIDASSALQALGRSCVRGAPVLGVTLGVIVLVTVLAHLQQVRFSFSTKALEPKPEKLNPVEGFQRLFALRNLVKSGFSLVKLTLIMLVIAMGVWAHAEEFSSLPMLGVVEAFRTMVLIIFKILAWVLAILLIVGVTDYVYQLWQNTQDLKMTKQEVKEERKDTDGDPEIKARIQRVAREIAMGRMRRDVPKADVIVTNPTHFAVALKYDQNKMAAPVVVAKGADFMAFRIREIAMANRVPIVEKPELARALFAEAKVGRAIDAKFYQTVAEVLAYVYRLQGQAA